MLTLSIRNEATSRVLVRWTGPASGDTAIEACDLFEMPLGLGAWRFDLRSSTDQVTLPIGVEPSDVGLTFIGIDEEGRIAIGRPPDNPRCANQ